MAQKIEEYQRSSGVVRSVIYDTDDADSFTIKTSYDYTNLADSNKLLGELHEDRTTNKHLARVPLFIYEQSVHENWDDADWRKFLNDPDNAAFRVWKGRV